MIFDTASELKWLNATPRNPIKGKYEFNLNRAHFDPQKTANEIKLIKNGVEKTTDKVDKTNGQSMTKLRTKLTKLRTFFKCLFIVILYFTRSFFVDKTTDI